MERLIVEFDTGQVTTYNIVIFRTYKKGVKEILLNEVSNFVKRSDVIDWKRITPKRKKGDGDHVSSKYINQNVHENIEMPMAIAPEIVEFAKGDGKGFTKQVVDKWNKHLDFDLHSKFERYGFTGSSRLNTIFKI